MNPAQLKASRLVAAPDWWLVRRYPDTRWPAVWFRDPVAAFTVVDGELVAVLADGTPTPRRPPEDGRDGADYHQRTDTFHACTCDLSPRSSTDPTWCEYCGGLADG